MGLGIRVLFFVHTLVLQCLSPLQSGLGADSVVACTPVRQCLSRPSKAGSVRSAAAGGRGINTGGASVLVSSSVLV